MKTTNLKKLGVTLFAVSALGVVANVVPAVGVLNPVVVQAQERTDQAIDYQVLYRESRGDKEIYAPTTGYLNPGESVTVKPIEIPGYKYAGEDGDYTTITYDNLSGKVFNMAVGIPDSGIPFTIFGYEKITETPKDQSTDPANNGNADTGGGVSDGSNNGTVTPPADNANGGDSSTVTPPSDNTGGGTTGDSTVTQPADNSNGGSSVVTPPVEQPKADNAAKPAEQPKADVKADAPAPASGVAAKAETPAPAQKQEAVKPKEEKAQAPKKTLPQTGESASVLSISLGALTLGLARLIFGKGRYQARHEK